MVLIDSSRQAAFAKLSGDRNPLHIDAVQARRSPFGACVVHGVHLILAALDSLSAPVPSRIVRLDAQFRGAVLVGESISFTSKVLDDGTTRLNIRVGPQSRATVDVRTEPTEDVGVVTVAPDWPNEAAPLRLDDIAEQEGSEVLAMDQAQFASLFPRLAASLVATDAAVLLAATRIVGMRCPGQWALFRRLVWNADELGPRPGTVAFSVAAVDHRFAVVTLALVAGRCSIRAEVIVREPPPRQADLNVVRSRVRVDEFTKVRALVVGGSRGLGELAAKVLVAGGAEAMLTYHTGADDAAQITEELGKHADMVQFDVEDPSAKSLARVCAFAPTHLLHFATPPIARRSPGSWDPDTYKRFVDVYVGGLSRLLVELDPVGSLESVFFPSSTFADDLPAGFAEYVAAKLAGESFCQIWQRLRPEHRMVSVRLPPLVTDQTAARLGVDTTGNLDVLVPIVRRLCKR